MDESEGDTWGREEEKQAQRAEGKILFIFFCHWHFVKFGVSACFFTVRRGRSCGQEQKEDKLGQSCSLPIFWESPW